MCKTNVFYIQNKKDLKIAYKTLAFIKEEASKPESNKIKEYIANLKKDIRNYYKRQNENKKDLINIFNADYDSFTELRMLPECIETQQEAIEYFEENLYIHPTYSLYDCTGKPFTSWYKICKRNNRFYVYHRVCFDI